MALEVYGDTVEEAIKNIRRSDEARASYYKNISELIWGDRHNYELMLNSAIGIEACANTVCQYVQNRKK